MSDAGCGTCRFFRKEPKALQPNMVVGTCRRNPPMVTFLQTPQGPQPLGFFPPTTDKSWCGHHDQAAADLPDGTAAAINDILKGTKKT